MASRKRPKHNPPPPEPSLEEEDTLDRLCSIRLVSYNNRQFEIKIFGINNYNRPFKITDNNDNTLATLQNENGCHVSCLLIRIDNSNNNGIRFHYNRNYVELLHCNINLRDFQHYQVGYVGLLNGMLKLKIVNNNNNLTIDK
ncbi:29249_t:CDS:1 [Racocetra persica]|uniref:29249_t:CDS:1 n=1 Tax=Racocetra persica TaxID=160502 RepID=A0ACA9QVT7_9GLOM|nr:29249_t:CDS:1 [Racocetra persica]